MDKTKVENFLFLYKYKMINLCGGTLNYEARKWRRLMIDIDFVFIIDLLFEARQRRCLLLL